MSLADFDDRGALLVMFLCRHCPYVKHVRSAIASLAREHVGSDLGIVAISANDPEAYPEDAPEGLAADAVEAGYVFPYLFDETQEVAKAFTAACTPTSSCSTASGRSSTGGSSTPAVRATASRSPARTCARRSTPFARDAGHRASAERRVWHQVAPRQRAELTASPPRV